MSRWRTLHIKNEMLFWFFTLALFPLVFLTAVNYIYEKTKYEEEYQNKIKLLLKAKVKDINYELEYISKELRVLSKTPIVSSAFKDYSKKFNTDGYINKNLSSQKTFFHHVVNENNFYDIFLIDTDGNIIFSVAEENDLGTNLFNGVYSKSNLAKVFKNSLELLDLQVSNYQYYQPSDEAAAFISLPIYANGDVIGILAVQIDEKIILSKFSQRDGLGKSGEYIAAKMDSIGNIIATTPLKSYQNAVEERHQFSKKSNTPIVKAVSGDRGHGILEDYDGKEVIAAWSYIPTLRWGIVAKLDLEEILIPIADLRFYSIIILFFVGLGVIAAIFTAIKHIVEPISMLTKGVKSFTSGDFKKDVEVDVDNEIGELSKTFNDMARSLTKSQQTIQKYAGELEEKVQIRTQELEDAKDKMTETYKEMQGFVGLVDEYIITSSTDLTGKITKVSKAFCDITGYSKEELIGNKHNIVRHPDMSSEVYKDLWKTITSGNVWKGEIKNQRKDGSYYWVESTVSPVFDEDGSIKEYTSIRNDITDKKIVEELSITDQLTKLYNRLKIEEVFKTEIHRAQRYGTPFSAILLDIDHFKSVNDNYGHDVGDEVLKDISNILKSSVRKTDIIGRWGGEEFLVIASDTDKENTVVLAEKIRKSIESHNFKTIGKKTSSFGVTGYKDGDTQEDIVKRADNALYKAKDNGRNMVILES